jgi:hypothetical protein
MDNDKQSELSALYNQIRVKHEPSWSGEVNLRHGRSEFDRNRDPETNYETWKETRAAPELEKFTEIGKEAPNYGAYGRYDGDGGNFGSNAVYLDHEGKWTEPGKMGRWDTDSTYDVNGKFENAKILTPENVFNYAKDINPNPEYNNKYVYGNQLAEKARAEGHDALIMNGFDKDYNDFMKDADYPGYHENEKLPPEKRDYNFGKLSAYKDRYEQPYKDAKLSSSIAQDQTLSFKPETLNVKKSDLTKPYEFTKFEIPPEPIGHQVSEGLLPMAAYEALHIGDLGGGPGDMVGPDTPDTFTQYLKQKELEKAVGQ